MRHPYCEDNVGNYLVPEEELTEIMLELYELRERDKKLSALEGAGVDNWDGYDMAMESFTEIQHGD